MARLAAPPLSSPIMTFIPTEIPLWEPLTFTPLLRQKLGKIWRLHIEVLSAVDPANNAVYLRYYYGTTIVAAALLGNSNITFSGSSSFPQWVDAEFQITSAGLFTPLRGVTSNPINVPAILTQDTALLVTGSAYAIPGTGEEITIGTVIFEELEYDEFHGVPILSRGP